MRASGWLLIAFVGGIVVIALLAIPRFESEPPRVVVPDGVVVTGEPASVTIGLADDGAGLRSVSVWLADGDEPLLARGFEGSLMAGGAPGTHRDEVRVELDAGALGLPDGDATLVVQANDWSLRGGGTGNTTRVEVPLRIDTAPPRVRVESGLTYVHRGGSAVVTYRVDEPTGLDGVQVGDVFYRGHPLPELPKDGWRRHAAFFAIPIDAPVSPKVEVVATDLAGNRATAGFPVRTFERSFSDAPISLSSRFLETVVPPLGRANDIDVAEPVVAFDEINTTLRARNEATIREVVAKSAPEIFFEGAFQQLRGSKVTSRFAEQRSYRHDGRVVSRATHFGFDLASTAAAPVGASNAGVVLFADDLGIYGNCVLLDHGMGLVSLYGHLSRIDVGPGDRVAQGQTIGLSGATGLAGGDHLHFAILVGDTYVDPLEWWDPKWVRSHIEERLAGDATTP